MLIGHLASNAAAYFEDFTAPATSVRHEMSARRANAWLHRFTLVQGQSSRRILVKEPYPRAADPQTGGGDGRPRLFPRADPSLRFAAEYNSLKLIEREIAPRDRRFSSIRALDFIGDRSAIVMEVMEARTLRSRIAGHTILHPGRSPAELTNAFRTVGAWLRHFHALDVTAANSARTTRSEIKAFSSAVTDYLADVTTDGRMFQQVAEAIARALDAYLPERPPIAVAHGDFAPRNIFVDDNGKVSVIDTSARWSVCRMEDVAYFMVSLRLSRLQAISQHKLWSPSVLQRWEDALMEGYDPTAEDISAGSLRAYQLVLLMDHWATRSSVDMGRGVGRVERGLLNRSYRSEAERLLSSI